MKRQGYRDSLHVLNFETAIFNTPPASGAFVPPATVYIDLFRLLSVQGGRQLSQSQVARVVGLRWRVIEDVLVTTTSGGWAVGYVGYFKPTQGRVGAHELAMKEWFGELEEGPLGGAARWRQFIVKLTEGEASLDEHSRDAAGLPFALSSGNPGTDRDVFGEYNVRFPVPPEPAGAGLAQRQFDVYAQTNFEAIPWQVSASHHRTSLVSATTLPELSNTGSTVTNDELWCLPGHHLPWMCGKAFLIVTGAGPRIPATLLGPDVPNQTASQIVVQLDVFVEGWHPLRRQKPGESRR